MAKDNKTLHVILGLIAHEEMSGYDIKKRIDNSLSFFWDAGFGQIYPSLRMLEKDGLVTKRTESPEKRPMRIVYTITESGRQELEKWLQTPVEKESVRYEILLRLFFGSHLSAEKNMQRIGEFQSRNEVFYKTMLQFKRELGEILPQSEDHIYFYLTVLFGEKVYKAYLDWAEEAVRLLGQYSGDDQHIP